MNQRRENIISFCVLWRCWYVFNKGYITLCMCCWIQYNGESPGNVLCVGVLDHRRCRHGCGLHHPLSSRLSADLRVSSLWWRPHVSPSPSPSASISNFCQLPLCLGGLLPPLINKIFQRRISNTQLLWQVAVIFLVFLFYFFLYVFIYSISYAFYVHTFCFFFLFLLLFTSSSSPCTAHSCLVCTLPSHI